MNYSLPQLFVPALALLACSGVNATTLVSQTVVPNRNDFTGTVGFRFTVDSTIDLSGTGLLVTALGFQDAGGDGLSNAHQVGIWDMDTGTLLAQATVAAGTVGSLLDDYRYSSSLTDGENNAISSLTLAAGGEYAIGAFVINGADSWTDAGTSAGFTISDDASAGVGSFSAVFNPDTFAHMLSNGAGNSLRWSPGNMQYTVVPEPGAALLGGLGLLGLLRRRR